MTTIPETPLCKLAYKYGTDKCPKIRHNYTPYYYDLLKKKKYSIKKVLEFGVGTFSIMKPLEGTTYDTKGKKRYQKGASLRMWRDFFPNTQIFGADVLRSAMFKDRRIKTFLCDERKEEDIKKLINKTGSDIDLFIDDATHDKNHQVYLAKSVLPLLDNKVTYIIEDVGFPDFILKSLNEYRCEVPSLEKVVPHTTKDRLIVIKK